MPAVYITDPEVSTHYGIHPAEWVDVADPDEAAWLVANYHGYSLDAGLPLPAAYFVHPNAPAPFAPYAATPPAPSPAPSPEPPTEPPTEPPSEAPPEPAPRARRKSAE